MDSNMTQDETLSKDEEMSDEEKDAIAERIINMFPPGTKDCEQIIAKVLSIMIATFLICEQKSHSFSRMISLRDHVLHSIGTAMFQYLKNASEGKYLAREIMEEEDEH